MTFPAIHLSFRMFALALLAAGALHYRQITSRTSRLDSIRSSEQRSQDAPTEDRLRQDIQTLRAELTVREQAISDDPNRNALLGDLARIMCARGLGAPLTHTGTPRTTTGLVQNTLEVEFQAPVGVTRELLNELSAEERGWRLSRLSIEQAADLDPERLTVRLQFLTFATAGKDGRG